MRVALAIAVIIGAAAGAIATIIYSTLAVLDDMGVD